MKSPALLSCLLICLIPGLLSCGSFREPDFLRIENLRVSRVGLKESNFMLDLYYFNPNKSSLKLKKAEGDAWLDENYLGHYILDTVIYIPANSEFRLPVTLKMDMTHILQNSAALLLGWEVMIKIDGKARLGKGLIFINYPIRWEGKQNLRDLMRDNGQ
jgi:LEA14-like dessication related protein